MKANKDIKQQLDLLRPYVDKLATTNFHKEHLLRLCLRASFVKSFQFVDFAFNKLQEPYAFFFVANLRGICEDIIFLRFVTKLSSRERTDLLSGLMFLEVHDKIARQSKFFEAVRPFQPVLNRPASKAEIDNIKDKVRNVWRNNGWANLNDVKPPTREIAEKTDPNFMKVVYDYIFRLTSGMVHFNPQVLLRSGWGPSKRQATFSTQNLAPYYVAFSRIYGAYLLCLYFEFFPRFLKPGSQIQSAVARLRENILMESRWPEMVTFEEMNIPVPQIGIPHLILRAALAIESEKGFLRKRKS